MKNFTKQNFKTNPLWIRLLIMAFMLLMGTGSALAYNQSAVDLYFDNSEAKWTNCYVYIGKGDYTSCYAMSRVKGTQYLWKLPANFNSGKSWDGATGWVVSMEKWWDNKGESIDKYTWHGAKNVTKKRTSAWSASYIYKTNGTVSVTSDGNTINAYNTTTVSKKDYTVTINTETGGTLTVQDYDNNAVANGASKIYLTVLKFSATPLDGYSLQGVEINDGTNTTTIVATDLATRTHTLTSNVTITPVWKKDCTPPDAPTFDEIDAQCGSYTLPTKDKYEVSVNWYDANSHEITSVIQSGTYYAEAVDGTCVSENRTDVKITIKTKPTISISGSEEAVLYEDVTLNATATDGATVKWYEGAVEKGEGLTYVVTSETATSKTITAKAFLNGCESDKASYIVNFEAEGECEHEIINNTNKTKVRVKKISNWSTIKIYAHSGQSTGNWPGADMTAGTGEDADYYVYTFESVSSNFKVIFNNGSSNGENQTVSGTATKGKVCTYTIGANSCSEDNNSRRCLTVTTTDYKTTGDVIITAPAVKITSLSTTAGEGNINFSGKIVKTGCDNSITYGFEYKAEGSAEWTQKVIGTNQDKDAGFDFSDNTVKELDGTYEVRAFITNDHSTQYSDVKTIELSTSKEPVKSATIELTALDGTPIEQGHKYCIGSTAYIKLTTNVNYTSVSWKSNQGAEIVPTRTTNIYQFTVKGNDEIVALVSNKYNDTPAESNSVLVDVYPEPISPTVSLSPNVICSKNDGATLSIASVAVGQTYVLYKYVDENDNEGAEVDGYDALPCNDANDELSFTNLTQAGRYFVKTYNTDNCPSVMSASSFATLEVVDASGVFIGFDPTSATTTPWMPAKFTVNASDKYTLTVPEGVVYNIDGNKVSVKIPLPEGSTGGDGQYGNVSFPQNAVTKYTITANLATSGGVDNPCAAPASATITLTPYVEPCTEGH